MALIKCHEYSGQVSDHARTCPHCGAPVIATIKRRQKAKLKFLAVEIIFVSIFAIAAWFSPDTGIVSSQRDNWKLARHIVSGGLQNEFVS